MPSHWQRRRGDDFPAFFEVKVHSEPSRGFLERKGCRIDAFDTADILRKFGGQFALGAATYFAAQCNIAVCGANRNVIVLHVAGVHIG